MHPCAEHVVKKLLVAGDREGGKDLDHDISDCIRTLKRWQEMRAEDKKSEVDTPDEPEAADAPLYSCWAHLPATLKWIATDLDGTVYAYEQKPWLSNFGWNAERGTRAVRITGASPSTDWRASLERRP